MNLRRVPILRVLWRVHLIFGGERELVLFVTLFSVVLPLHGMNLQSLIVGILLWLTAMPILRWMAKKDPQFSQVYRRFIKYRRYYPARSRPYRDRLSWWEQFRINCRRQVAA